MVAREGCEAEFMELVYCAVELNIDSLNLEPRASPVALRKTRPIFSYSPRVGMT